MGGPVTRCLNNDYKERMRQAGREAMKAVSKLAAVCVFAASGIVPQSPAFAADLVVLSNQGAVPGLTEIAAAFSRMSGHKVTVVLAEGDVLGQRLAAGTVDLVSQNPG